MKTISIITFLFLFAFCSFNSNDKATAQKVSFGIYETVKVNQIPVSITETLKKTNIQYEKDTQLPTIGYILKTETLNSETDFPNDSIQLIKSVYTVDKEGKYVALAAVKSTPSINIKDISKTVVSGKNVEIRFNMNGAKKWAAMTKQNIGNYVAFVIDNQIYTMPLVNAEIKNGMALINGFENEIQANKISDLLNAGIAD